MTWNIRFPVDLFDVRSENLLKKSRNVIFCGLCRHFRMLGLAPLLAFLRSASHTSRQETPAESSGLQ